MKINRYLILSGILSVIGGWIAIFYEDYKLSLLFWMFGWLVIWLPIAEDAIEEYLKLR